MGESMEIVANGVRISLTVEGHGPWIVFGHSMACDRRMWAREATALSDRFTCLRLDFRGHGNSDSPQHGYAMETLADDVKGVLASLGVELAHWVGLSMGGVVGQLVELAYPGTFRTMTLANTTAAFPAGSGPMWSARADMVRREGMSAVLPVTLERWFTDAYRAQHPDRMTEVSDWILSTTPQGYRGCAASLPSFDVLERLHELACPTLIIAGRQDQATPLSMAQALNQGIKNSRLTVIDDAAHLSNIEQPKRFLDALNRFYAAPTP